MWYDNAMLVGIAGAVAGAIVTGLVSYIIIKKTTKIKRVDGLIGNVSSLLSFSENIKEQLEIKYANVEAHSVYMFCFK